MKYINLTKQLAAISLFAVAFTSCDKVKEVTPLTTEGKTLVKILGAGTPANVVKKPVDFLPTPTKLLVVELRRDIPNETELNKQMIVTVKDDTAAVTAVGVGYLQLPTAWYTIQTAGVKTGGQGGTFTFTFAPGEYSKEIYITIPNATLFNPSALYGLGFTITTADAGGTISTQKSVVVEIGAKNDYDGSYAVTGPMLDAVNPALVQWNNPALDAFTAANGGAWNLNLVTTGANSCVMYDNTIWGDFFHPILSGTSNSGYGTFALIVNFNPANKTVSSVTNYYAPAPNTRQAQLDPSGVNAVQGNKDILIKYFMLQPSLVPAPPYIRTTFDEKWKYIGPR
jgi:hypothetical protein